MIPSAHNAIDVAALVRRAGKAYPRKTAIVWEDGSRTYGDLLARIDALAGQMREMGVREGERVGLALANGPVFVEGYLAAAQLGAIAVPLNPRQSEREHDHILGDSEPRVLIADGAAARTLRRAKRLTASRLLTDGVEMPNGTDYEATVQQGFDTRPPRPAIDLNAPVAILYTSGTTGQPKGVVRSQFAGAMIVALRQSAMFIGPETVLLASTPMFHAAGHEFMLLQTLAAGGTVISRRSFDAGAIVADVDTHRATHVFFVPTMSAAITAAMTQAGTAWPSVRLWMSAASPLPDWVRDAVLTAAPAARLWNCYGLTEGGTLTYMRDDEIGKHPGTCVGLPGPGMEVRVVDTEGDDAPLGEVGEIVCRSPESMSGYWHDSALTAQAVRNGWVHSGDLGFLDADGFLTLSGRLKDVVITGGENVYAAEVEGFLLEDRAVRDAAVIGVPHPHWGEAVVAVVVPSEPGADLSATLDAHAKDGLAPAKRPKRYVMKATLPRNSMGKIVKDDLRDELAALFD
ncbi:MAG: class I adenylate-forming enzyme family protein [Proteobacteria bacterium]|nr:class I adenylate-forming enzyme family protein [Pseudomonadota bacterium]